MSMNKKTLIAIVLVAIVALGAGLYFIYPSLNNNPVVGNPSGTSIAYKNTDYGFNFSLPTNWQGYSIVKDTWKGTVLTDTVAPTGTKLLIRNPNWTVAAPYEDLPILVFTIAQWNAYLAEDFSVSGAPMQATELGRNNRYVFTLPPRWDFDYSIGYKDAQNIIAGNPLHAFNL